MATIFSVSRRIEASPERVYALMTDLPNAPAVVPAIRAVEILTEGPVRVGTRFKETRVVFGREHAETFEVTELAAARAFGMACTSCGARYDSRFTFRPDGRGTIVEMTMTVEPLTTYARIVGFLMRPMMKKMVAECAKDLDAVAAAATVPGTPPPFS
jgi:ribosome-associated toxin RatA of RatAB toxin-antitoxin module